ncbi:hypothetical protein SLEP1_g55279 [Rubroshorea leprosula]|uniref:Uncharacterized protein n=1 Tax=Rubroshorea leprosula TaxID=152421 RepID=A0AAV5MG41_9ROSI|nr:hypothetical protein SLEP1_g55279 [Rubroshorea leprosula]
MTSESMDLGDQVTDAMFIKSPKNGSDGPQGSNSMWIPNDEKNASGNGNTHGNPDLNVGDAINSLKNVDSTALLQFLHPILNMLLHLIGNGGETLQVAGFRAMVNILTRVQQPNF